MPHFGLSFSVRRRAKFISLHSFVFAIVPFARVGTHMKKHHMKTIAPFNHGVYLSLSCSLSKIMEVFS